MPGVPAYAQYAQPQGPIGQMRPTGMTILLFFVTLGIWGFIYYFQVQEEMKRHTGEGLGGVLALVIAIFFGIVYPFLLSNEVGHLYSPPRPGAAGHRADGAVVLPRHPHPRRPVHLVRPHQRRAQRVLESLGAQGTTLV